MRRVLSLVVCVAGTFLGMTNWGRAQSPVVINELMYNPPDADDIGEYVELYNSGYGSVDLSNWRFSDGIDFTFPEGTVLDEGDYLVVCRSEEFVRSTYGINNAIGNFTGRLDNGGERVRLVNSVGMVMDEVWYHDENPWPASPDGVGYSLELRNPSLDNELSCSWFGSLAFLGTPGARNSAFFDPATKVVSLIRPGEKWRFFRGRTAPSDPPDAWAERVFDDSRWEEGASGFGYGDNDDATVLSDMQNNYVSVYIRKEFTVENASLVTNLKLTVDYDDGFVAYLNGWEPVRRGLGEPGSPVSYLSTASDHEAGTPESFNLGSMPGVLRTGSNVLALEGHNISKTSGDLSLIPSLEADFSTPRILINEFQSEPEAWLELYNPSSQVVVIGGYFLTDDPANLTKFGIPEGTTLERDGFAAFTGAELGFDVPLVGGGIYLVGPDGSSVVDAFTFGQQYMNLSYGRYPDGSDNWYFLMTPSKGKPNEVRFRSDIVINEIMYHPLPGHQDEEYIELYNRGDYLVELQGWELAGGIGFTFPEGTVIPPGKYLVVAKSVSAIRAKYGISGVLGDYSRQLRNYGEEIILKDRLGNPADIVRYADDPPWPVEADGLGRSLELTHPELDNSFGQLWAASDSATAPEGTPGSQNSAFMVSIPPAIVQTRHSPVIPTPTDTVTVTTRVIDDGAVTGVSLFYRKDGEGAFSEAAMTPQGNGSAKDRVYEGSIPAQGNGTRMEFCIRAEDETGKVSLFPAEAPAKTCLYLVEDSLEPGDVRLYRVVMTNANYTELTTRDVMSDLLLDATFIYADEIRYNVGIRYRGYGSRHVARNLMSYRIDFSDDNPFGDVRELNLNGQNPSSQWLGWDILWRAGLPHSRTKWAYLKINDMFQGLRIQVEGVDEDYLRRVFPEDSSGNLYRADWHPASNDERTNPKRAGADLSYRGENPDNYRPWYFKRSNELEDDYSDIIHLCYVFDPTTTPSDADFEQEVSELINVEEWITYFAVNSCINNKEGAIYNYAGDDYYIYRYPLDGKWYLIPWDLDNVLNDPTESIFAQTLPSIVRLLSVPRFRLMYYRKLQHLLDYEFSERQMFAAIDSLQGKFAAAALQGYKSVVTGRIADIRSQIVTELTVEPPELGVEYIRRGDEWRFFRGKKPPSDPPDAWKGIDFDDSGWEMGPSGFGYADGDDATPLSDMLGSYFSVYIRKEFMLASAGEVSALELVIDYDDGFVAYLNGTKVAEGNMGPAPWSYNTPAADGNHEAGTPEVYDITKYISVLRDGKNVLAIEGHNGALGSSDFSLIPALRSVAQVVENGGRWIVNQAVVTLTGTAPVFLAESVTVNGAPGDYELGRGTWSCPISLSPGANTVTVVAIGAGGATIDSERIEIVYVPSDRVLRGELGGNCTWTREPSPYVIAETVVVPAGTALTIEPGTEVMLAGGQSLVVMGTLLADGTENEPIVFTRHKDGESWGSIVLDGASPSELRHCVVEYSSGAGSYDGKNYTGAVAVVGSQLDVDGCIFRRFPDESATAQGTGIDLISGAGARISDSRFVWMGAGVHTDHSYVLVENCVFSDMHGGGNDPVDVNGASTPMPVVRNNLFMSSEDDGIDMDSCSPLISGNAIYSCTDKGISVGAGSKPRIENNVLTKNGTGIAVMDSSAAFAVNNTIVGNVVGLHCYERTSGQGGGVANLVNCIVWGNQTEVVVDAFSSANVSYSDVKGGSVWPGKGNVNADPLFADLANSDFRLTKFSPCTDAGTSVEAPGVDAAGNPRPRGGGFDMGAYESPYWKFVDSDGDQIPDGWEEHFFNSLAQGAQDDFDNDGMKNLDEYDVGADPTKSDTDGDGLPDGWEWSYALSPLSSAGEDGRDGDPDWDGMTNYEEYVAGTVPTDANSVFEVTEVLAAGDTVGVRWQAEAGREYRVLASDDMVGWSEVGIIPPGDERPAEWFDGASNGQGHRFYRLEVLR